MWYFTFGNHLISSWLKTVWFPLPFQFFNISFTFMWGTLLPAPSFESFVKIISEDNILTWCDYSGLLDFISCSYLLDLIHFLSAYFILMVVIGSGNEFMAFWIVFIVDQETWDNWKCIVIWKKIDMDVSDNPFLDCYKVVLNRERENIFCIVNMYVLNNCYMSFVYLVSYSFNRY